MKKTTSATLLPFANIFLVLSLAYYWMSTTLFNPFAIFLCVAFALHYFFAKEIAKYIFPVIFLVINLYMFLALFSEFSEFDELNKQALMLLGVGFFYLGANIASAIIIMKNIQIVEPAQVSHSQV